MDEKNEVKIYKALGEPTRLKIIKVLSVESYMACMDMTNELEINSNSTLSHHLKILIDAGLITMRKEGTYRYYSVNFEIVEKYAPALLQKKTLQF